MKKRTFLPKPVKPKRFYKMIAFCRACKAKFNVDLDHRSSSRNYCVKCTEVFKKEQMKAYRADKSDK